MFEIGKEYYVVPTSFYFSRSIEFPPIKLDRLKEVILNRSFYCNIDEILIDKIGYENMKDLSYSKLKSLYLREANKIKILGKSCREYTSDYLYFDTGFCYCVPEKLVFLNKHKADECRGVMMNLIDISKNTFSLDRYIKTYFK